MFRPFFSFLLLILFLFFPFLPSLLSFLIGFSSFPSSYLIFLLRILHFLSLTYSLLCSSCPSFIPFPSPLLFLSTFSSLLFPPPTFAFSPPHSSFPSFLYLTFSSLAFLSTSFPSILFLPPSSTSSPSPPPSLPRLLFSYLPLTPVSPAHLSLPW